MIQNLICASKKLIFLNNIQRQFFLLQNFVKIGLVMISNDKSHFV